MGLRWLGTGWNMRGDVGHDRRRAGTGAGAKEGGRRRRSARGGRRVCDGEMPWRRLGEHIGGKLSRRTRVKSTDEGQTSAARIFEARGP